MPVVAQPGVAASPIHATVVPPGAPPPLVPGGVQGAPAPPGVQMPTYVLGAGEAQQVPIAAPTTDPAAAAAPAATADPAAAAAPTAPPAPTSVPAPWQPLVDPQSGATYYLNTETQESLWEPPSL